VSEEVAHQAELCSLCLNLCMDVCPVSVHAGRADLMPNVKTRSAAAVLEIRPGAVHLELLDACTDCGACTDHCLLEVPVADLLKQAAAELRERRKLPAAEARPAPPPLAPTDPDAVPSDALALATCPEGPDPAARLPGIRALKAPLGSACCGACLPAGVGDGELHLRMARGMLSRAPDGATVVVSEPSCAAHLAAASEGRVRVICVV
jgi:ferredoxin